MLLRSTRLALAAFLLVAPVFPQAAEVAAPALSPKAAAIAAASREHPQVMRHLDYLTNSIGPRLTGSEALVMACEWAAKTLEGYGLKNVRLEEWGEVPVSFNRGPWFGAMIWKEGDQTHREVLEFNTPAWSAGTKGLRRAKAILLPKSEEEFEKVKGELKGAWLVRPVSERGGRFGGRRGPRPDREQGSPQSFDARAACEKEGVLGTVDGSPLDELLRTGSDRSVNWREVHMDKLPRTVRVTVVGDQHKKLMELLGKGIPVELEFSIQNRFRPGPVKLYNVVADIPGTEKPGEFVMLGGHIDSWDGSTGTVDNGSGCATAIEAVRLIMAAGVKPKRTIRIALWSGEEQGLLGSRAYVQTHKDELPRISAYLNHDSGTNFVTGVTCTKAMEADLKTVFAGVGSLDEDMPFGISAAEGLRGGGSDHSSFLGAGVPAWSWHLKGTHDYGHIWHTQFDQYEQAIEAYQQHSATVIAIAAVGIADLDELLSREKLVAPRGPSRSRLGIALDGTKITSVVKDSAAAKAGLEAGDQILKVGDQKIEDQRGLFMALFGAQSEKITVTVLRSGKEVELTVTRPPMRRRR